MKITPLLFNSGAMIGMSVAAMTIGCSQMAQPTGQGAARRFLVGAFLGDNPSTPRYDEFVQASGIRPALLVTFVPWLQHGGAPFPANFCRQARERGATPLITWEPWDPPTKWHASLSDIAAGREDWRLQEWAIAAREWRSPMMLRFAHEMNGDWYPWCERHDPTQSAVAYVAAWRRVRAVFRQAGATNVSFVWSANFEPTDHIERFYPGSAEVDWIGIDLYNQPRWPRDPAGMVQPLVSFAKKMGKKVLLTEVGCSEEFLPEKPTTESAAWADKPRWVNRLFEVLAEQPTVCGLIWFNVRKEADWRINSSPQAVSAFRQGLLRLDSQDVTKR